MFGQNWDYTQPLPKKRVSDKYDGMMVENKENVINDTQDDRYDKGMNLGDPETADLRIVSFHFCGCGGSSFMLKSVYNEFAEEVWDNTLLQWDQHQTQYKYEYKSENDETQTLSANLRISIFDLKGFDDAQTQEDMDRRIGESMHSNVILLMYSIDNKQSFDGDYSIKDIKLYLDKHLTLLNEKKIVILVGTKLDLENESERVISKQQGTALANEWKIPFIEISNKTGQNVRALIEKICEVHKTYPDGVNYPPKDTGGGSCCVVL